MLLRPVRTQLPPPTATTLIPAVMHHPLSHFAVPWDLYTFPEFPYPENLKPKHTYPCADEVHAYICAYAHHFDLVSKVRASAWPGSMGRGWWCLDLRLCAAPVWVRCRVHCGSRGPKVRIHTATRFAPVIMRSPGSYNKSGFYLPCSPMRALPYHVCVVSLLASLLAHTLNLPGLLLACSRTGALQQRAAAAETGGRAFLHVSTRTSARTSH